MPMWPVFPREISRSANVEIVMVIDAIKDFDQPSMVFVPESAQQVETHLRKF